VGGGPSQLQKCQQAIIWRDGSPGGALTARELRIQWFFSIPDCLKLSYMVVTCSGFVADEVNLYNA
jgi:hypothetical protein